MLARLEKIDKNVKNVLDEIVSSGDPILKLGDISNKLLEILYHTESLRAEILKISQGD